MAVPPHRSQFSAPAASNVDALGNPSRRGNLAQISRSVLSGFSGGSARTAGDYPSRRSLKNHEQPGRLEGIGTANGARKCGGVSLPTSISSREKSCGVAAPGEEGALL